METSFTKSKPRVIFVGNTGCGSSFLCNSLLRAAGSPERFESCLSICQVTTHMQAVETDHYIVVDVPGFNSLEEMRTEKNKEEIKKGLGLKGDYYVVFVVILEGSHIRGQDDAMIKAVCEAFDAQEGQLAVVINIADEAEVDYFNTSAEQYRQCFARACSGGKNYKLQPNHIICLPKEAGRSDLSDESLALLRGMLDGMVPHSIDNLR